jgi:hypothetical protein
MDGEALWAEVLNTQTTVGCEHGRLAIATYGAERWQCDAGLSHNVLETILTPDEWSAYLDAAHDAMESNSHPASMAEYRRARAALMKADKEAQQAALALLEMHQENEYRRSRGFVGNFMDGFFGHY